VLPKPRRPLLSSSTSASRSLPAHSQSCPLTLRQDVKEPKGATVAHNPLRKRGGWRWLAHGSTLQPQARRSGSLVRGGCAPEGRARRAFHPPGRHPLLQSRVGRPRRSGRWEEARPRDHAARHLAAWGPAPGPMPHSPKPGRLWGQALLQPSLARVRGRLAPAPPSGLAAPSGASKRSNCRTSSTFAVAAEEGASDASSRTCRAESTAGSGGAGFTSSRPACSSVGLEGSATRNGGRCTSLHLWASLSAYRHVATRQKSSLKESPRQAGGCQRVAEQGVHRGPPPGCTLPRPPPAWRPLLGRAGAAPPGPAAAQVALRVLRGRGRGAGTGSCLLREGRIWEPMWMGRGAVEQHHLEQGVQSLANQECVCLRCTALPLPLGCRQRGCVPPPSAADAGAGPGAIRCLTSGPSVLGALPLADSVPGMTWNPWLAWDPCSQEAARTQPRGPALLQNSREADPGRARPRQECGPSTTAAASAACQGSHMAVRPLGPIENLKPGEEDAACAGGGTGRRYRQEAREEGTRRVPKQSTSGISHQQAQSPCLERRALQHLAVIPRSSGSFPAAQAHAEHCPESVFGHAGLRTGPAESRRQAARPRRSELSRPKEGDQRRRGATHALDPGVQAGYGA